MPPKIVQLWKSSVSCEAISVKFILWNFYVTSYNTQILKIAMPDKQFFKNGELSKFFPNINFCRWRYWNILQTLMFAGKEKNRETAKSTVHKSFFHWYSYKSLKDTEFYSILLHFLLFKFSPLWMQIIEAMKRHAGKCYNYTKYL